MRRKSETSPDRCSGDWEPSCGTSSVIYAAFSEPLWLDLWLICGKKWKPCISCGFFFWFFFIIYRCIWIFTVVLLRQRGKMVFKMVLPSCFTWSFCTPQHTHFQSNGNEIITGKAWHLGTMFAYLCNSFLLVQRLEWKYLTVTAFDWVNAIA